MGAKLNVPELPEEITVESNKRLHEVIQDQAAIIQKQAEDVGKFLETFKEFPPRQKAASFTIDQIMEQLSPLTD